MFQSFTVSAAHSSKRVLIGDRGNPVTRDKRVSEVKVIPPLPPPLVWTDFKARFGTKVDSAGEKFVYIKRKILNAAAAAASSASFFNV